MSDALPFIREHWASLLLGWFLLSCVLAALFGRAIPRAPERDQQEPRDVNAKFDRGIAELRVIHHHATGDRT